MERRTLESSAANYPYLRGLWAIPLGFMIIIAGISNLQRTPTGAVMLGIVGGGLMLCLVASLLITRYYQENYGEVTPTKGRQVRNAIALVAWVVVLFVGGSKYLFWSPDSSICVYAVAFALATLTYYAILVGLRTHHFVIWGSVAVAGLLPIWGGLGLDRDPVAMLLLGVTLMVSGFFDQRLLARTLGPSTSLNLENRHVGG
jgi:hypothetical protein